MTVNITLMGNVYHYFSVAHPGSYESATLPAIVATLAVIIVLCIVFCILLLYWLFSKRKKSKGIQQQEESHSDLQEHIYDYICEVCTYLVVELSCGELS